MYVAALLAVLLLFASFAEARSALPISAISVKTRFQSFIFDRDFFVDQSRLYERLHSSKDWQLFNGTGLIFNGDGVSEISADGNDLLLISNQTQKIYFYRYSNENHHFPDGWQPGFGQPFPQEFVLPSIEAGRTGFSISQRGLENFYFEDAGGNHHPSEIGCDGMLLLINQTKLFIVDNWSIPDIYLFRISLPFRNRLPLLSFSISSSTLFVSAVLNSEGDEEIQYFTAFGADYDILGFDPLLLYSYNVSFHGAHWTDNGTLFNPYVLPTFQWIQQTNPSTEIAGKLSSTITVLQTGEGNEARELRIVGADVKGNVGYFTKKINDNEWTFVADSSVLSIEDLQFFSPSSSSPSAPTPISEFDSFSSSNSSPTNLLPLSDRNFTIGPLISFGNSSDACSAKLQLLCFQTLDVASLLHVDVSSPIHPNASFSLISRSRFEWPASGKTKAGDLEVPADVFSLASSSPCVHAFLTDVLGSTVSASFRHLSVLFDVEHSNVNFDYANVDDVLSVTVYDSKLKWKFTAANVAN